MSVANSKELLNHLGHKLCIAYYGVKKDPESATIECDTCKEVLVEFAGSVSSLDCPRFIHTVKHNEAEKRNM